MQTAFKVRRGTFARAYLPSEKMNGGIALLEGIGKIYGYRTRDHYYPRNLISIFLPHTLIHLQKYK